MRPLRAPAFLASMVLLLPATRLGDDVPLRGFTAESARAERQWEKKFRVSTQPDSMRGSRPFKYSFPPRRSEWWNWWRRAASAPRFASRP